MVSAAFTDSCWETTDSTKVSKFDVVDGLEPMVQRGWSSTTFANRLSLEAKSWTIFSIT
ncbi:unannotated protein [freshwater metagenome]|uniref:Unannotated protein n=1 Tax=freshwater metagenome TaxID=449393 RepID=A0A6J6JPG1_9ZZZZ